MTQTLSRFATVPATGPLAVMVVPYAPNDFKLFVTPMRPVEEARDEYGGTLADALLFVDAVCCTECGTEASETRNTSAFARSCQSCQVTGCACIVVEDAHTSDVFWCLDCQPQCGCRECLG